MSNEKLSPEAQQLFNKYANGSQPQETQYQGIDANGQTRVTEALNNRGISDRTSTEAYTVATRLALAREAHARAPHTEGVGGRSLSSSTKGVRVGRSLSDMANDAGE